MRSPGRCLTVAPVPWQAVTRHRPCHSCGQHRRTSQGPAHQGRHNVRQCMHDRQSLRTCINPLTVLRRDNCIFKIENHGRRRCCIQAAAHLAGSSLPAAYGLDVAGAAGAMVAAAAGRPVLAPIRLRALANMALMSPPPLQSAPAETLLSTTTLAAQWRTRRQVWPGTSQHGSTRQQDNFITSRASAHRHRRT